MKGSTGLRGFERSAGGVAEFVLELPSDLDLIEATVAYLVSRCRAFSFHGPRLELNFRVGVTEALSNAILYGNAGDPEKIVRVEVVLDASRVAVSVIDEGQGFDPESIPDPTRPENLHATGGRGLFLIRELMDETHFSNRGNSVHMVLCREIPLNHSSTES